MIATRRRADLLLVERGLFDTRARAQAAIAAGLVVADGKPVAKPSVLLSDTAALAAEAPHPYVSRGGVKLAAALDRFGIDPTGLACLDLGASTGGFSDCLIQRGAARVFAVDVGRGQLHPRLSADPRVISLEATDARALGPSLVPRPIALLVADLSFISLKLALPPAFALLGPGAAGIVLVKPQFEAGRAAVSKGKGVIRDTGVQDEVLRDVSAFLVAQGAALRGSMDSPILGSDGNREFLAVFDWPGAPHD